MLEREKENRKRGEKRKERGSGEKRVNWGERKRTSEAQDEERLLGGTEENGKGWRAETKC